MRIFTHVLRINLLLFGQVIERLCTKASTNFIDVTNVIYDQTWNERATSRRQRAMRISTTICYRTYNDWVSSTLSPNDRTKWNLPSRWERTFEDISVRRASVWPSLNRVSDRTVTCSSLRCFVTTSCVEIEALFVLLSEWRERTREKVPENITHGIVCSVFGSSVDYRIHWSKSKHKRKFAAIFSCSTTNRTRRCPKRTPNESHNECQLRLSRTNEECWFSSVCFSLRTLVRWMRQRLSPAMFSVSCTCDQWHRTWLMTNPSLSKWNHRHDSLFVSVAIPSRHMSQSNVRSDFDWSLSAILVLPTFTRRINAETNSIHHPSSATAVQLQSLLPMREWLLLPSVSFDGETSCSRKSHHFFLYLAIHLDLLITFTNARPYRSKNRDVLLSDW